MNNKRSELFFLISRGKYLTHETECLGFAGHDLNYLATGAVLIVRSQNHSYPKPNLDLFSINDNLSVKCACTGYKHLQKNISRLKFLGRTVWSPRRKQTTYPKILLCYNLYD